MAGLFDALIQQESGGRPGVVGPQTKWGRALGLTQMLPATAQEMARKIGVPWRPELLTAKDQGGAAYQRQLGQAYFNEGLQKTGNERDALRYYHGGPNRQQWGPKTNAYADQVLARVQGGSMPQRRPNPIAAALAPPQQPLNDPALSFMGAQPVAAPQQFADAPQIEGKKPGAFGKGGKGWMILGALGDALAAYGGQKGAFMPAMLDMQQNEAEEARYRERIALQTQAAQAKANEPPTWLRDAQIFSSLPRDQQQMVIQQRDAMFPVMTDVTGADGSVTRQQVPRALPTAAPQPGAVEDGYVFMGGDPKDPANWRQQ